MTGETALVTGGAGGIGSAICRRLAADGWRVAVCFENSENAARMLAEETGGRAFRCDVADSEAVRALFLLVEKEMGAPSLLVNNAGTDWRGLIQDMTDAEWRRVMAVNLDAAFYCSRAALGTMIRAHKGAIINIASIWGEVGASCEAAYSAAKAGIIGLTRALAKEVGPSGIRVNCVAPGCIATAMLDCFSEDEKAALAEETPLGRIGTPDDAAAAVAFLASPAAAFITGQILGVGGGFGK